MVNWRGRIEEGKPAVLQWCFPISATSATETHVFSLFSMSWAQLWSQIFKSTPIEWESKEEVLQLRRVFWIFRRFRQPLASIEVSNLFPSLYSTCLSAWFSIFVEFWRIGILGFMVCTSLLNLVVVWDNFNSFRILNQSLDYLFVKLEHKALI